MTMDDLSGLSWNGPPSGGASNGAPSRLSSTHTTLRPNLSPALSRQPSPVSAQQSGTNPFESLYKTTSSNRGVSSDGGFPNLLSSNTFRTGSVSLQEKQKQLLAERARQDSGRKGSNNHYNTNELQFLESLGSGRGTPGPSQSPGPTSISASSNKSVPDLEEDDILAAFNASAPVDSSSHFPPPSNNDQNHETAQAFKTRGTNLDLDDNDDPFGLGKIARSKSPYGRQLQQTTFDDDDDLLGPLGKPVSQMSKESRRDAHGTAVLADPREKAMIELMDMGFPAEQCREALAQTQDGVDVQAAVGYLLNQAHARSSAQGKGRQDTRQGQDDQITTSEDLGSDERAPAWMKKQQGSRQNSSKNHLPSEREVAQKATEFGASLFKSANSLWKQGQKKVQKAVADFQQDGDRESNQPKWMRDTQARSVVEDNSAPAAHESNVSVAKEIITDEAMLLETGRAKPSRVTSPVDSRITNTSRRAPLPEEQVVIEQQFVRENRSNNEHSITIISSRTPERPTDRPSSRPLAKISRQAVEEQSAQAYISPARRRKQPSSTPSEPIVNLLETSAASAVPVPSSTPQRPSVPAKQTVPPKHTRSPAPTRQIPQTSPSALATSVAQRQKGTEAFKRGDYAEAHGCYTSALSALPDTHPIVIVLRCNRALTNIKIGDPKGAISDADSVISLIGASLGEGETISMGGAEGDKPMKEFYGKALMRKAEALENMERWADGARAWRDAVEAGVGGSVSIQGRNRCEKAAGTRTAKEKPVQTAPSQQKRPPSQKVISKAHDSSSTAAAEAVKRLRAQNAAAEAASDEAFALNDVVEAKLVTWKGAKADNLRALLASLDAVLWADAGWKKVGMGDLIMPAKVKINYMKAIAKVHPDKISQTASTEQRMISAAVFATLNEAWDKFKKDNNL